MQRHALYSQLAEYYDKYYWSKDYGREVDFLVRAFKRYGAKVRDILEVACGTGNHTKLLASKGYRVTGVDISEDVLRVARRKLGRRASFVQGDMRELDAVLPDETYDAVVCLFSSISYNRTASDLKKTLRGMYNHTRPGGVVAFDTPFTKQGFVDGYRGEDIFDDGRMIGARLGVSKRNEDSGEITFSYLIKDGPETIVIRNDVHRLGLFSKGDFRLQMRDTGFAKLQVFTDWTFDKKAKPILFSDTIFVGMRPEA
jgi:dTDP-3-amino-3,4,6-trideoxy-alpha-D-glucopyranose N,N-dimethyltransferase